MSPEAPDSRLEGLPGSAKVRARNTAQGRGLEGWLLTLDFPCYFPVLQYAHDAALRREMYFAYVTAEVTTDRSFAKPVTRSFSGCDSATAIDPGTRAGIDRVSG